MDIPNFEVTVVCLFCESPLKGGEHVNLKSGDLITCSECGEANDYDSVVEVAQEKGVKEAKARAITELEKHFRNLFK